MFLGRKQEEHDEKEYLSGIYIYMTFQLFVKDISIYRFHNL